MSILSAIFSRKKKNNKSYVTSVFMTEYFVGISVYEKTLSELIFVDSRVKDIEKEDFGSISEIVEGIITPIEKSLDTVLVDTLFVIPSFAISETDGKVAQPFRGAIRQLIRDFELNALGYVDLFEVVRLTSKENQHWLFLERGMQNANLILCANDEVKKRLKVTSDADEICAHIEESATKKVKIICYSPVKHEDELTFERNLAGYSFAKVSSEDIVKNIRLLLSEQFFGEQIKIAENTVQNEVAQGAAVTHEIEQQSNVSQSVDAISQADVENIIIEKNPTVSPVMVTQSQPVVTEIVQPQTIVPALEFAKENTQDVQVDTPQASSNVSFDDFVVYSKPEDATQSRKNVVHEEQTQTINNQSLDNHVENNKKDKQKEDVEYVHYEEREEMKQEELENSEVAEDEAKENKKRPVILSFFSLFASWMLPTIFAVGLAIFAGLLIFFHKADVTLVVKTKDFKTNIALKGFVLQALNSEKDITATVESSGAKEIGERAKGQVIIASFDDKVASFSAGTTLAAGSKIFRLDDDVTLEASTVDTAQGTKVASKKTVKASATFIGPDGNIDKGVDMTVNDNPKTMYYAVAESAFTGGSKQTVAAISQDDIDALDAKLQTLAENASRDAEMSSLKDNEIVIRDLSESTLEDVEYSAAVGDAKTEVSATAVAKYTIYYGANAELIKSISSAVKSKVGNEYVFDQKNIDYETKKAVLKSGGKSADLDMTVSVSVYLPPARESIKKSLVMKPISSLDSQVAEPNNLSNIRVKIDPQVIPFEWFMPLFGDNINIKVISDSSL